MWVGVGKGGSEAHGLEGQRGHRFDGRIADASRPCGQATVISEKGNGVSCIYKGKDGHRGKVRALIVPVAGCSIHGSRAAMQAEGTSIDRRRTTRRPTGSLSAGIRRGFISVAHIWGIRRIIRRQEKREHEDRRGRRVPAGRRVPTPT